MSHTEGPLTIRDNGYSENIAGAQLDIMPPNFDSTAPKNKLPFPLASISKHSPNYKENAALFAAAPDLLAACQAADKLLNDSIKEYLDTYGDDMRHEMSRELEVRAKIVAAMMKAAG